MDHEGGAAVRFMSVRELRSQSAKLWETLKESGEVVVTSNGRPVALLSPVDEESVEEELLALRRARAVLALESLQRTAERSGSARMTPQEVEAEIQAVRARRRRP